MIGRKLKFLIFGYFQFENNAKNVAVGHNCVIHIGVNGGTIQSARKRVVLARKQENENVYIDKMITNKNPIALM